MLGCESLNGIEQQTDKWVMNYCLSNSLDELSALAEQVEVFAEHANWGMDVVMQVNLVLEELVVNTIDYGYTDGRKGKISVRIESTSDEIWITIDDNGDLFNPFSINDPDLSLSVEERPIGGLGVFLVRNYMDSCAYNQTLGHNQVVLNKQLNAAESS